MMGGGVFIGGGLGMVFEMSSAPLLMKCCFGDELTAAGGNNGGR